MQHKRHLGSNEAEHTLRRPEDDKRDTTMAYANTHSHRASGLFAGVFETLASLRAAWDRSRVYVRTYNELNALSTRELADLGISRSMISRLAYEAAYGRDA